MALEITQTYYTLLMGTGMQPWDQEVIPPLDRMGEGVKSERILKNFPPSGVVIC